MTTDFTARIATLAEDRKRGSSAIVTDAATALLETTDPAAPSPASPNTIRQALIRFRHGQPAMAQVLRFCAETWHVLDHVGNEPVSALNEHAKRWVTQLVQGNADISRGYAALPRSGLPLMTYSSSSAVIAALKHDSVTRGDIWLSDALPGGEGRATAERLADHGWTVHRHSDAHLFDRAATQPHRLLLGADAVTPSRFLNKIGSGALARLTAAAGGEVIVCAGREKVLRDEDAAELVIPGLDDDRTEPLFGWGELADVTWYLYGEGHLGAPPGEAPSLDPDPLDLPDALRIRR